MDDAPRMTAHVLLDSVVALGINEDRSAAKAAILSFTRINDIPGAVTAKLHRGETDDPTVSVTMDAVFLGTMMTMEWFAIALADARETSVESVIADAREYLDSF